MAERRSTGKTKRKSEDEKPSANVLQFFASSPILRHLSWRDKYETLMANEEARTCTFIAHLFRALARPFKKKKKEKGGKGKELQPLSSCLLFPSRKI
ncbi:hypothetical protein PUN28_011557 [Cardiocondyla obscurior]|uniref:Uncharacterized protein n=1 Tax=Cardiocondyla obscurior TaxID=286306 RepID=A0AAW2FHW3_9HYME